MSLDACCASHDLFVSSSGRPQGCVDQNLRHDDDLAHRWLQVQVQVQARAPTQPQPQLQPQTQRSRHFPD